MAIVLCAQKPALCFSNHPTIQKTKIAILMAKPLEEDLVDTKRLVEYATNNNILFDIIDARKQALVLEKSKPGWYSEDGSYHNPSDYQVVISRVGALPILADRYKGLALLRQFEAAHVPVVNSSISSENASDKWRAHQILASQGIPSPNSIFTDTLSQIKAAKARWKSPGIVFKQFVNSLGLGVYLAEDEKKLKELFEQLQSEPQPFFAQHFVEESRGSDIRLLVVGEQVVGAMKRSAKTKSEWRSNVAVGGEATAYDPTDKEKQLAIQATKALGLDVAGVDELITNKGPQIMEVNVSPGLKGIEAATGKDIARDIIEYALQKAKQNTKQ